MLNLNVLSNWLFATLVSMTPKTAISSEPSEIRNERLHAIAEDIVSVVYSEKESSLFSGVNGKEKSAIFIATWAAYESGWFHKNVDKGTTRGDSGRSWCIMQLNIGKGKTKEGWTGPQLVEDRKKCISAGYHIMKSSMKMCKGPERDAITAYMSGNCTVGLEHTRKRYDTAMTTYRANTLDNFLKRLEKENLNHS